ncbi:MAG: hypothetical protein ACYC8T_11475, partial [Myxococcaceae bacterium]
GVGAPAFAQAGADGGVSLIGAVNVPSGADAGVGSVWATVLAESGAEPDGGVGLPLPPAEAPHALDPTLDAYRTAFEALTERAIGKASRPVRYDWRKSTAGFGLIGSQLNELNNFYSVRYGLFLRTPSSGLMIELATTRVETWSTDSSDKLAMTPYRQYGRPSHWELDVNVGIPLAEGVVTAWPGFFPAVELVVNATVGFRYLLYTDAFGGAGFWDVAGAIFAPRLTDLEQRNLGGRRPPGMQVDDGRYGILAGLTTDLYFQSGLFVFPRAMVAVPLLNGATQTHLGFWWELSVGVGWAL